MDRKYLIGSASALALLAAMPGAQAASSDASQIAILKRQIQAQQQQLQQQQQMLDSLIANQQQTKTDLAKVSASVKPAAKPSAVAVMSRSNKPGWRSADGQNEIDLGALLQVDAGLNNYHPGSKSPSTAGLAPLTKLQSGINARRAQIQVTGTFAEDFHFALQYDMGGSNEQFGASAGGIGAGVKTALFTYTGFKPYGTNLSLEFGYTSPPVTIDSAIPANAGLFMEHPTPDRLQTGVSGGPGRATLGFRDFTNRWFTYFALSGPNTGSVHDSSVNGTLGNGTGSQNLTAIGRVAANIINQENLKIQLGGGFERYLQPPRTYSLSDEAEDRVDPTTFVGVSIPSTAANTVTGGGDYTFELAGEAGPVFVSGAYIHYDAERRGLPQNNFWGAYGDVMYSITGEKHPYLASAGGWGNLSPAHPVNLKTGGLGAWEVGLRYSYADLNDAHPGSPATASVTGGRFYDMTFGINWYLTDNLRAQLNWLHGFQGGLNPNGPNATTATVQTAGAAKLAVYNGHWDQVGVRMQFSF